MGSSIRIVALIAFTVLVVGCSDSRSSTNPCSGFDLLCENSAGVATCTPVSIDPNNCGSCGNVCALGQTCSMGSCTGTPVDGSLPDSTAPRDMTSTGTCSPTCNSSQRCCGDTCVTRSVAAGTDGREDPSFDNCNGCGLTCDPATASACAATGGGAPHCVCGSSPACTGARQCVASGSTFACVDMGSDPNNCGAVGHVCGLEELCVAGVCTCGSGSSASVCGEGTTCCGGSCLDTSSDNGNCGGCGTICGEGTTCSDSMCRCGTEVCDAASESSLGELCCDSHCVANDNSHCGGCETVCDPEDSMTSCVWGSDITGGASRVCCGFDFGDIGGGGFPIPGGGGLPMGAFCLDPGGELPFPI